jgi:hypothetical protein
MERRQPTPVGGFTCRPPAWLCFFLLVNWLHGLDQATTNLLHKKIRREDGATCSNSHPTALFPQELLSQGHADSPVRNNYKGHPGPDRVPNSNFTRKHSRPWNSCSMQQAMRCIESDAGSDPLTIHLVSSSYLSAGGGCDAPQRTEQHHLHHPACCMPLWWDLMRHRWRDRPWCIVCVPAARVAPVVTGKQGT